MMRESVAIIGGGPSGAALATFLARSGMRAVVFDTGRRPELIVGESLVPAVVPVLKQLGIEDEIRSFATYKPGASFYLRNEDETIVDFEKDGSGRLPPYSYNVPRDLFDACLLRAAERAGARIVRHTAKFEALRDGSVCLSAQSLDAAGDALSGQPDFFVDASGRSRVFAKLFSIGERRGYRNDVALFAHLEGVRITNEGHIHVNRLKRGWSWRIPLPGRTSVGIVAPPDRFAAAGSTAEEQYDEIIESDEILSAFTSSARRVTPVVKYSNYQLVSETFHGPNWAMCGDAAGFTDPIFSSGLHLALEGARSLAEALADCGGSRRALARYERRYKARIAAWQDVVEGFYSGRLFGLMRAARLSYDAMPWKLAFPCCQRQLKQVLSGMTSSDALGFRFARFLIGLDVAQRFGNRLRVR